MSTIYISTFRTFLFFIFISLAATSCIDCIPGEGELSEERRALKPFEIIVVNGSVDVIVHQNKRDKVEDLVVKAQENLLPYISTENVGSKLVIEVEGCIEPTKQIEIYVAFNELSKIISNGSADIRSENILKCDDIKIVQSGSGDIDLRMKGSKLEVIQEGSGDLQIDGKYESLYLYSQGSGDFQGDTFSVVNAEVMTEGSGDVVLETTGELDATSTGSGDITYSGSPTIKESLREGSGIIKSKK